MKINPIFYELIFGCGVVLSLFFGGMFLWSEATLPNERTYTDLTYDEYNDGWSRVYEDGSKEEIKIPSTRELAPSEKLTISKTIDYLTSDSSYISFNSAKQDVYAYVDDELRYSYSTKDTRAFGKSSPGIMVFIPLYQSDIGKTLTLVMLGDNNYTGTIDSIYMGSQAGIIHTLWQKEIPSIVIAIALMVMGIPSMILGIFCRRIYHKTLSLGFAGWGAFFAGLWAVCESCCRQFLFANFSMASNITFLCLISMIFALALYFDCLQQGRYRLLYMLVCILAIVESVVSVILQFTGTADLVDTIGYTFVLFIAEVIVYVVTVIPDFIHGRVKEYLFEFIGILGAVVAGILQVADYGNHPMTMDTKFIGLGLLFMLFMSYFRAIKNMLVMEREVYAAKEASEASTAFLTRMSHEMRTPINAILGMNKMILKESQETNILDYSRDVNTAGNYLLGIVNEVLDLAKVTAGKIEIEPAEYDLMNMIRECYSLVSPRAKANRLSFVVEMDDVLPSMLYGDRQRVIQVVTNLLTNAVKYTPTGRVTLTVQGKISEGRLLLIISVADTGIGISEENIPYLFDSFKRIGNVRNKKIEGTGLGLSITKQLVELMDGQISVESTLGKGSIFTVVIPQGIRSVEPCGSFSMGPNGDRRVADRNEILDLIGNILVVDDVAINLRVFTMLLKDTGVKVDVVKSGEEAIEHIKRSKYDIIFIDHLMPGMDGIETIKQINELVDNPNKSTPIIMQTANTSVNAKEEYASYGFSDYIAKPIKDEELRSLLKKYLL